MNALIKKFLLIFLAVFLACIALMDAALAGTVVASVEVLHGRATILRPGISEPFGLEKGAGIMIGDVISVSNDSSVRLAFPDGLRLNILKNSGLRVNQYIHEPYARTPERKRVMLVARVLKGVARLSVNPSQAVDYQVFLESDTAMVAAGGGDMVVIASAGETKVVALNVSAEVRNIVDTVVGAVTLYANQKTVVKSGKPPAKPAYMTPEERRAFLKETRVRAFAPH